jgi:FkbH-like protein
MTWLLADLPWLAEPPESFSAQCRAVLNQEGDLGNALRGLANYRLDGNQLFKLAQTLGKARAAGRSLEPLSEFRLGLISNATTDFLAPTIVASAARHGIDMEITRADYGQVLQEALNPESRVNSARPAAVLLAIDYRGFPLQPCPGDAQQADRIVAACIAQVDAIRSGIKTASGAICVLQTLAPPLEGLFGNLDRTLPGTPLQLIESFNQRLAQLVRGSDDLLLDVAGLAQSVGLAQWHDPTSWNIAKLPFAHAFLPLYGDHVGRLIGALRGKARRCLILDLDNTLWGGVIGDDGLEGIVIAQGDATGEAYLDVQRTALALRGRGIVLAVSSKNTDEIARRPFNEHPEMLLKLDHIAVFQANWNDKATNIQAIARELQLGLDAMVFLDDNPAERGLVRQVLPQVAVPELPADPALYARTLMAAGYFESTRFSAEDLQRADFYQDNSRRAALAQSAGDIDSYLASLQMQITFQAFDETGRTRIAQLINKSNQFNLTTRRYSEADVGTAQNDSACLTLQVRLSDIFGDNGMISVVICRRTGPITLEFDTWLMSCRVLGRRVENMVLQEIIDRARDLGIVELIGRYIPTERNGLVAQHYDKLGFEKVATEEDGTTVWKLNVQSAPRHTAPMVIRRIERTTGEATT